MKSQHTKQAHLQTAQADTQTKVCKRACFSPTQDKNFIFFPALRCFNFFSATQPTTDKTMDKIYYSPNDTDEKAHTANKVLPQWGLTCFYETFVHKQTVVHLLNFGAKNPPLRQYPNRWQKRYGRQC